ncbi:uncharacterized protein K452DRAFT_359777 [Aplosporella prunicola CBS 121167]|uniref:Phospholipase n=1 Tax=Aplosporella prunicola CBS 121167 TaxID=1176127 RepID=A0A6A6B932_9PEZI|nr:uncharacterized protein K452DRAFT_359777 [Aplosporella prunicola CBS 121167]KAF2140782.1 hypothetical protein K452DRAFT_359777 [Aplosporella prunicola CBS 121167]
MSGYDDDDHHLAYGEYHGSDGEEGERGFIGDIGRHFLGRQRPGADQQPAYNHPHSSNVSGGSASHSFSRPTPTGMSSFFHKVHEGLHDLKESFTGGGDEGQQQQEQQQHNEGGNEGEYNAAGAGQQQGQGDGNHSDHRFLSFAPQRHDNDIKWFVDACGYMWAVSEALEKARESIWILDWWLSPELYLRRPPARNEQYRIDRMLEAAASRGVKVNIIVYKEVTQALTLSSAHTKHHLEKLHPNIAVFRHPDHLPDRQTVTQEFIDAFKNISLSADAASKLPGDTLKALYGMHEDTVLYWAHHEKLCLIDGHIAFMGGLDLCYGRWDTNQHSIADAHPGNLDDIIFPGQDFNNARIMDFQDVANWQNNKLDRTVSSRMGWSDVSLCISGPVVHDLKNHFVQRWNFIYHEKYKIREDDRYKRLSLTGSGAQSGGEGYDEGLAYGEEPQHPPRGHTFRERVSDRFEQEEERFGFRPHQGGEQRGGGDNSPTGPSNIQLTRSCAKWSHGVEIEHSIQNAYVEIIRNSKHFIYIENQFFITATCDDAKAVKNKIGAAMVERVLRAARNGEKWKMIVMIPAVPAFPGDLRTDEALSTRAIMEFQYNSINRGHGKSIYEQIAKEGVNPMDYIRFYNLRTYDRINVSAAMKEAEDKGGVQYEEARRQHDVEYGGGYQENYGEDAPRYGDEPPRRSENPAYGDDGQEADERYGQYQEGAERAGRHQGLGTGRWDTVSSCYMLGGEDLRNVPWEHGNVDEIDAFVSEELYIHSKLLIADDRIVICGSANLNDRSQLGDHDSEIAVVIEDPTPVDSLMDGQPWRASKFAASLRRQLFRKHLGLLVPQDIENPNENYMPIGVPNTYDWGSQEDEIVTDPISDETLDLWNGRAKSNTDAFQEVFHCVPYDGVRTWKDYDEYYERYFKESKDDDDHKDDEDSDKPRRYKRGHVVAEKFAPGPEGAAQVKEILGRVRGMLVEMPLLFLKDEDIAKEGVQLNAFTEEVYT